MTQPRTDVRVATLVRLPFDLHRELRRSALERGETATALLERALRAELERLAGEAHAPRPRRARRG